MNFSANIETVDGSPNQNVCIYVFKRIKYPGNLIC